MPANMQIIELKNGEVLKKSGDDADKIYYVISGRLKAYTTYGNFIFGDGTAAGIVDAYYGINIYTYAADTDCRLEAYSFDNMSDVARLCGEHKAECGRLVISNNEYIMEMIKCYLALMMKCRKKEPSYTLSARVSKWELDKYNSIAGTSENIIMPYFSSSISIAAAELAESSRFATVLNDVCLEMADFTGINMDYVPPAARETEPALQSVSELTADFEIEPAEALRIFRGSLEKIIVYSNLQGEDAEQFRALMADFKKNPNRLSSDDDMRRLRKRLTDIFYKLYYNVFMRSLQDENIPYCINMFLNFGFIDEELLSEKSLTELYKLSHIVSDVCNGPHVYTMYNWLKHILWGEKEPSRNSFDQNYDEYVRTQARMGKLNEADALNDNDMKLQFEINNMFMQTHRMTYGRVSSFVPFLVEDNILKTFDSMLVTAEALTSLINHIRSIDFSLFFRSSIYSDEKLGITRECVYKEALPDIILTPCIGSCGAMWQEIEGRRRDTGARFIFPVFCSGKLDSIMLNVLGHFRWEMCKRIQGNYWNNITEKSLTSEYYDYLQFYRRNRDISEAVKEKIKSALLSARNNFSEVFARDYEQWITYESSGSSRLNKVSRLIMAKYCPFNKALRTSLKLNPAYAKDIEIYERNCAVQKKHLDLLCRTLEAKGIEIPSEIAETKAYLSR